MVRWQRPLGWVSLILGMLAVVSVVIWVYGVVSGAVDPKPLSVIDTTLRVGLAVVLLLQAWVFLRPVSRDQPQRLPLQPGVIDARFATQSSRPSSGRLATARRSGSRSSA